jgi:hypothetical protein
MPCQAEERSGFDHTPSGGSKAGPPGGAMRTALRHLTHTFSRRAHFAALAAIARSPCCPLPASGLRRNWTEETVWRRYDRSRSPLPGQRPTPLFATRRMTWHGRNGNCRHVSGARALLGPTQHEQSARPRVLHAATARTSWTRSSRSRAIRSPGAAAESAPGAAAPA